MKKNFLPRALLAVLAMVALGLAGCSSGSGDTDTPGSGVQVEDLSVSPASIQVGATAVVEALVTNGTDPLANRQVWFAVSPTTAGYFTPAVDTSDANGEISAIFTALDDGSITITAYVSESSFDDIALSVTPQVHGGSGNVDLTVIPTMIQADGASTSELTIIIRDANGQPAPESTMVRFAAGEYFKDLDGNGYWTTGADSLVYDFNSNGTWDAIGNIPSVAYTEGDDGEVTVTYTSSTAATTVYVRATVDPNSGITGFAEATIQLTPDAAVASIYIGAESMHLAVKRTGGMETSTLYAIGYDAFGNPVPEGVQISFIITDGPDDTDDGERLGTLTGADRRGPYVAITNSNGVAECPVSSGTVSGTIRIRAYVDTVLSNSTVIMVHAGPPVYMFVAAKECNVPFWDYVNRDQEIVAIVSDIYNNPVRDSTAVYFTCDEGIMLAHLDLTKDETGIAESKWLSPGPGFVGADGDVWVYAETEGGTVRDSSYFINSSIPDTLWFVLTGAEPFPTHINADGKAIRFFQVQVRDLNFNFVEDETEIDFESDFLTVAGAYAKDGCHASLARSFITSVILEYDDHMNGSQDDGIGAIDRITATYKGFFTVAQVCTVLTGPAYSKQCQVEVPASVTAGTSVPFSAIIKDRWGNVLGDHLLTAAATDGSVSGSPQRTDMYGEAAGFNFTAPPAIDSVTSVIISITDTDPLGGVTFNTTVSINLQ